MPLRFLLTAVLIAGALPANGAESPLDDNIDRALGALGIAPDELGFHKQWATDSFFRLRVVDSLLDNPLDVAPYTDSSAALFLAGDEPVGALRLLYGELDVALGPGDSARVMREVAEAARTGFDGPDMVTPELHRALSLLLGSFRTADRYLDKAVAGLSETELDILLGEAPDFWADEDDSLSPTLCGVLHREFGREYDTAREVDVETLLVYVRKLDRRALALSGLAVAYAASEAVRLLTEEPLALPHEAGTGTAPGVDGGVYFHAETEFGPVVVGAGGRNVYHKDCAIIIDLGGSDRYENRAGGAVGVLGGPFAVCIDLKGDDVYSTDRLFSQGAALFGCGVLADVGGDDVYQGGSYAQGAGVFGTGLHADRDGDDIYRSGFCTQGAGMVGVGMLADAVGDDTYRCWCYGQGFGSVWGYGLALDFEGDDCWYAGGKYRHEPLRPRQYRSFAQGFAIGWRPDASGGIGMLCDGQGNDFYNGDVFCQATSYWYALAMLWDGEGYDHYVAGQYSQGAGIHLAVAGLIDVEGDDSYYSRWGPSQGEGHDLSVGVLVDRSGDDVYHASGGQGIGLTNSVGLLVDVEGNDVYSSNEKIGQGAGRPARGFGSAGLFLELAGDDHYVDDSPGRDGRCWTQTTYGAGIDLTDEPTVGDEEDEGDTVAFEADSLEVGVDSLFKLASLWEVGNARAKVKQAREKFHALGTEALDYVFREKVTTKSGLESRAVEKLVQEWPDSAKPYLYRALHHDHYRARANAVYWLGKLGEDGVEGIDSLFLAMREKRASPRWVAKAVGEMGDSTVVPRILFLLEDDYEPSRIVTAEACGKLKNPVAIPALIKALSDRLFTVRSAAEDALVKTRNPSLGPLLDALAGMEPPGLGHAVRAVGRLAAEPDSLGDRELAVRCRRALAGLLGHDRPFVRLVAVEALEGFLDDPLRRTLEDARAEETDRFVLDSYRKLLDGK